MPRSAARAGILSVLRSLPRAPETGQTGDPGLFGPGSVAWKVNGETAMLLGGGRALLMQMAHPSVAAAVADHSDFPAEPFDRLWRTIATMLTVTFGDTQQSREAAEGVTGIHRGVVGATGGGVPYRAMDPDLLLWVHATLVDSAIVVHEALVGAMSSEEIERYHREMQRTALAFGVPPERLPADYAEFADFVKKTLPSLRVTDPGRALSREILSPRVSLELLPAARLFRLLTIGLLPASLREEYRLAWGRFHEWMLVGATVSIRTAVSVSPGFVRRWPHARWAERRVGSGRRPT